MRRGRLLKPKDKVRPDTPSMGGEEQEDGVGGSDASGVDADNTEEIDDGVEVGMYGEGDEDEKDGEDMKDIKFCADGSHTIEFSITIVHPFPSGFSVSASMGWDGCDAFEVARCGSNAEGFLTAFSSSFPTKRRIASSIRGRDNEADAQEDAEGNDEDDE